MTESFLDDLILDQVTERADRPAIIAGDISVSYADLARDVSAFAHALHQAGVSQGDFVVVLTGPTSLIHMAALAILRLGAVYVPLDPDYPDGQLSERLLELTRVTIVASAEQAPRAAAFGHRVVVLERASGGGSAALPALARPVRTASDPACVFFTSGSTGKPKATLGSIRAVTRSVVEPMQFLGLVERETINSIARYSWSISLLELFGPLAFGGTCLLLDRMQALSMSFLVDAAARTTGFHCPPALLAELSRFLEEHPQRVPELSGVRVVWYGGDSIAPGVLERCRRVFPAARLATAYGCTEIFGLSHAHFYAEGATLDRVLIGQPAPGVLQELLGEPGGLQELLLGGDRVALGYRGHDELNRERFVVRGGVRFYRTGDYVRSAPDGALEFVERQDSQVKIRGVRVEIGEVESSLRSTPGVADGLVLALDAIGGTKELHGFFVPSEAGISADTVRRHLSAALPEHLRPAGLHALPTLPMTANFKIDRKRLVQLARERSELPYDPDTDLGRVATAWQTAGARLTGGPEASFFDQGGDSLSAARLAAELSQTFGVVVEVADVFASPSLDGQVARVVQLRERQTTRGASSVAAEAQRGLFFRELLERRRGTISCTRYIRRAQGFDDQRVQEALRELVGRFPTLRTGVRPDKGELTLDVREPGHAGTPFFERAAGDWSLEPSAGVPMLHKRPIHFELASGALAGAVVSRLADGGDLLQLTAHHIAADDNSMGRLATDFVTIYEGLARGRKAALLPLASDFSEFCAEQRAQLASGAFQAKAAELGQRLVSHLNREPTPLFAAPSGGPVPPVTHTTVLGKGQSPRFSDVVAALASALGKVLSRPEFVFCAHVALRRDEPLAPRVGMFVNLLPLFCATEPGAPQTKRAASAARALREAMARSDVPYELMLRTQPELRRRGRFPFDAFVNELRFDNTYPAGYEDVYVRRSFATDASELSLSVVRRPHADELLYEAPGGPESAELLARVASEVRVLLDA